MSKTNKIFIGTILLNLIILTSTMPFLPWYIEDGWGNLGLFITTPLIIAIIIYLSKKQRETTTQKINFYLPFVILLINFSNILLYSSDVKTIVSLIINIFVLITLIYLSTKNN